LHAVSPEKVVGMQSSTLGSRLATTSFSYPLSPLRRTKQKAKYMGASAQYEHYAKQMGAAYVAHHMVTTNEQRIPL
jgi:hypothetical protein